MTHRKPNVGDRVRVVTALAPAPVSLGTVGIVTGTDQDGEAYGPFDGRSDMIYVDFADEWAGGQFAPEELEVVQ